MFEAHGLDELVADLTKAPAVAAYKVRQTTQKAALNIKTDAQRFATGIGHAPHYPRSITYETDFTGRDVTAVVGPDKDKPQGALGNILEYGTANNAPRTHLGPAFDRELPNWQKYLEDIVGDVL